MLIYQRGEDERRSMAQPWEGAEYQWEKELTNHENNDKAQITCPRMTKYDFPWNPKWILKGCSLISKESRWEKKMHKTHS